MIELIAIKKNDKYYLRNKSERFFDFGNIIFNKEQLPSFSKDWKIFNELPTQIQRKYPSSQKIVGYSLMEGYAVSEKTPLNMPADSFDYLVGDDTYKNPEIRGLYQPNYEVIPERFEDMEFTIELIDTDCEPLINPKYSVTVDFPYFIENHEAVGHKYPCHIEGKQVFNIIKKYVKDNLPEHCKITSDYDFHFCVELIVPLIHEETITRDISRIGAKKPKYQTVPLRSLSLKIIDISIPGDKYGKTVINGLSGMNYKDLECKIDTMLETYKEVMQHKLTVCSHCKGYGAIDNQKSGVMK